MGDEAEERKDGRRGEEWNFGLEERSGMLCGEGEDRKVVRRGRGEEGWVVRERSGRMGGEGDERKVEW